MADTRYESRYNRTEMNVMWTIAFVILLLVLIIWGVWYFSRPEVGVITTTEIEATGNVVTPATASDTTTQTASGTSGASSQGAAGSSSGTGTVY